MRTLIATSALMLLALSGCARDDPTLIAPSAAVSSGSTTAPPSLSAADDAESCATLSGGSEVTANLNQVTATRVGDSDRIEFRFEPISPAGPTGLPRFELARVRPPFRGTDDSDVEIDGEEFFQVVFHGGSGVDTGPEGYRPVYSGPKEIKPSLEVVVELQQTDDFERTLVWVVGTDRLICPKITEAKGPDRLLIDFSS